jgi:vancomycin resistance protein YoaR
MLKVAENKLIKNLISHKWMFMSVLLPIVLLLSLIASYNAYFNNRIFPGVKVAGVSVSGMTRDEAKFNLENQVTPPDKIAVLAKNTEFDLSLSDINFSYDYEKTVDDAFNLYRSQGFISDQFSRLSALFSTHETNIQTRLDDQKLEEYLQVVSSRVAVEPTYPKISLKDGSVAVDKGVAGEDVDHSGFKNLLHSQLAKRNFSPINIPFQPIDPTLTDAEKDEVQKRAEKLIGKSLVLTHEYLTINLSTADIFSVLNPRNGYDPEKIAKLSLTNIAPKVNREAQNAVFRFENEKVVEFTPARDGIAVDTEVLTDQIVNNLTRLEETEEKVFFFAVPVKTAPPAVTTAQVNDLGIKELLGRGTSSFRGSIPGRVFNIGHAANKLNGVLVPPGETLSFNDAVGEVSSLTGYKQAYIIQNGMTVLGDGGGVCQVSTTLFRAALNSGLPIEERRAHSYRVSYYEQDSSPGLDATVYAPTTDLKIKNDTPAHMLVQTIFVPQESLLVFEIYGTSDGRVAKTTKPVVLGTSAPPEDLYIDDPTLPEGQIKQIDYKAWGAKVTFDYSVERNGETIYEKTFLSNFRPWQAKFLRGTGPAVQ